MESTIAWIALVAAIFALLFVSMLAFLAWVVLIEIATNIIRIEKAIGIWEGKP